MIALPFAAWREPRVFLVVFSWMVKAPTVSNVAEAALSFGSSPQPL